MEVIGKTYLPAWVKAENFIWLGLDTAAMLHLERLIQVIEIIFIINGTGVQPSEKAHDCSLSPMILYFLALKASKTNKSGMLYLALWQKQ